MPYKQGLLSSEVTRQKKTNNCTVIVRKFLKVTKKIEYDINKYSLFCNDNK